MKQFKDMNSTTLDRIKATVGYTKKPASKPKAVRTGDKRIDAVNNPGRTFKKLLKETNPK
jgi:hypothetical protein